MHHRDVGEGLGEAERHDLDAEAKLARVVTAAVYRPFGHLSLDACYDDLLK